MSDKPPFRTLAVSKTEATAADAHNAIASPVERKGQVYALDACLKSKARSSETVPENAGSAGGIDIADIDEPAWDCFFVHLAKTADASAALQESGISAEQALIARTNDPEKALRWQQALAASYDELEMELLYRARFGMEKPIFYGGKRIDTTREFDNGVALRLLGQHRSEHAARQSGTGAQDNAVDVLRERLLAYRRKVTAQDTQSPDNPRVEGQP